MAERPSRVLLVEDDRVFADLLTKQFSARGSELVHCASGKEAMNALEKESLFDVILLDVALPDIDGFEILSRIRAIPALAAIPVVVISNFTVEQDIEWGRKLGVTRFVKKISVMPGDIVDTALKACEKPPA